MESDVYVKCRTCRDIRACQAKKKSASFSIFRDMSGGVEVVSAASDKNKHAAHAKFYSGLKTWPPKLKLNALVGQSHA